MNQEELEGIVGRRRRRKQHDQLPESPIQMRRGKEKQNNHPLGLPMPLMEIPTFEGVHPCWWLRKCERLFEWYNVPRMQRVSLATAYFNEGVDAWFQGCLRIRREYTWE